MSFARVQFVIASLLLAGSARSATTWWVDVAAAPGGNGSQPAPLRSIQAAIDRSHDGDTILVAPGIYHERLDYVLRSIRVASTGGAAVTTIRGNRDGSVVRLKGGYPVLEGFTVENGSGNVVPGTWKTRGGGVLFDDTVHGVVRRCIVRGNYANEGDGIGALFAQGLVYDTVIEFNGGPSTPGYCQSGDFGGGVYGAGTLWLSECTLRSNEASIEGGGAYAANLDRCFVENNRSAEGAGVSRCQVFDSWIQSNRGYSCDGSSSWGGGAYRSDLWRCNVLNNTTGEAGGGAAFCTLRGSLVRGNSVLYPDFWMNLGLGGGTFQCVLEDCVVDFNAIVENPQSPYQLLGRGGGAAGGTALRTVFRSNSASQLAGVWQAALDRCVVYANNGVGLESSSYVVNSIVRANSGGSLGNPGWIEYSNIEGGAPGLGNIDADPLFWAPEFGYFQLLPGSPCIDSGHPGMEDPDGSRADMGAFPFDPTIPPPPLVTCVAPPSSDGCVPELALEGRSLAQGARLSAIGLPAQRTALLVIGTGRASLPIGSGTCCVAAPRRRTVASGSGGADGSCEGTWSLDLAAWSAQGGAAGLPTGAALHAQLWYRDPGAPGAASWSNALQFALAP